MAEERWDKTKEQALDASFLSYSIDHQIAQLKQEASWQTGDRNAVTLEKNPSLRVTLVALRKSASLREHHVEGPITVYVVEGSINFSFGRNKTTVNRNGFVTLDRTIPHDVEALEESVILLTIVQPQ